MTVYSLYGVLLNESAYIDLINDDDSTIKNFFVYDEGSLDKKPIFRCQSGFNLNNINKTDLYESTCGMLVFSKKFYEKMHSILNGEMVFYEAELRLKELTIDCYVGKIVNIRDILNKDKTIYDDWLEDEDDEDDEPFIDEPVFLKNIPETKYCVKNRSRQRIEVFTEKFKNDSEKYNLKLRFESVEQI